MKKKKKLGLNRDTQRRTFQGIANSSVYIFCVDVFDEDIVSVTVIVTCPGGTVDIDAMTILPVIDIVGLFDSCPDDIAMLPIVVIAGGGGPNTILHL